jgi:hypothetical protein
MMSLSLPGNQTGTNYAFAQVDNFETIMNCQTTNSGYSFRIQNVEIARITNISLSVTPNNGNRNPTQALDVLGNAVVSGNITLSTGNIQSSKFKVTQAGNVNSNNTFTTSNSASEVTIANTVGCSGGTIVFHISCGGYATTAGFKTLTFRYKNGQGTTRATITASFFLNQTGIQQVFIRRGQGHKDLQVFQLQIRLFPSNEMTPR